LEVLENYILKYEFKKDNEFHDEQHGANDTSADTNKLYEILGIDKSATQEEIRKVYKKLALANHPNRGGDIEKVHKN
jgi:DnaJ family protein A protein 2